MLLVAPRESAVIESTVVSHSQQSSVKVLSLSLQSQVPAFKAGMAIQHDNNRLGLSTETVDYRLSTTDYSVLIDNFRDIENVMKA